PLWFGAGYFSWTVASVLLDGADRQLDRPFNLVALPVVAAFVMTQWDLVMDAPNATIAKVWIWHDGGGVFGVPLSNYLGWLLTSWLIFQAFALYLRRSGLRPYPRMSLKLPATGILFYVGAGLTHIVPWIMGQTGEAVDARGYSWQVHDIREATVAILLLTMVFTALLAALRLLRQASSNSGPTTSSQENNSLMFRCSRLGVPAAAIAFQSSNAWDAYAGSAFGMQVVWCNRYRQRPERLPGAPDRTVKSLAELPALVGAS